MWAAIWGVVAGLVSAIVAVFKGRNLAYKAGQKEQQAEDRERSLDHARKALERAEEIGRLGADDLDKRLSKFANKRD